MSRARHHEKTHKASGGRAHEVVSGNPDVLKEAKGEEPYDEGDERKRGGKAALDQGFQPEYSEVYLRYGKQREVCFRPGAASCKNRQSNYAFCVEGTVTTSRPRSLDS